jgi:hypothetical protein
MTKRAVVVGVNNYATQFPNAKKDPNLRWCVNDANAFYHLLIEGFGFDPRHTWCYTDARATRSNILSALSYTLSASEPGDVVCFYFSGHGTRRPALPGRPDCDTWYEAIIPFSGDFIADSTLLTLADTLNPSQVNFTVVLDSCHSGGMGDRADPALCRTVDLPDALLQGMVRSLRTLIPVGVCLPTGSGALDGNVGNVRAGQGGQVDLDENPDRTLVRQARSTLVAGCRFDQLSWEHSDYGHGLLTQSFLDLVNQSNFTIDHTELLTRLAADIEKKLAAKVRPNRPGVAQVPQLRGQMNRMEEAFLTGWTDSR